jgi:hypothetical protein
VFLRGCEKFYGTIRLKNKSKVMLESVVKL